MKKDQDRLKSYTDNRRRPLEFVEGDHTFLKVTPWLRLKGPFLIMEFKSKICVTLSNSRKSRRSNVHIRLTTLSIRDA